MSLDRLIINQRSYYGLLNPAFRGWLSMESHPQNPEFRNYSENFHPCFCNLRQNSWAEFIYCTITKSPQGGLRVNDVRGQNFHSPARNYEWNLESTSNSSQSTHPVERVLWEEILEKVKLHITSLCSLLHTLLKDKCMCLPDEWKLKVTCPAGQVQYWNIFVPWIICLFV